MPRLNSNIEGVVIVKNSVSHAIYKYTAIFLTLAAIWYAFSATILEDSVSGLQGELIELEEAKTVLVAENKLLKSRLQQSLETVRAANAATATKAAEGNALERTWDSFTGVFKGEEEAELKTLPSTPENEEGAEASKEVETTDSTWDDFVGFFKKEEVVVTTEKQLEDLKEEIERLEAEVAVLEGPGFLKETWTSITTFFTFGESDSTIVEDEPSVNSKQSFLSKSENHLLAI